MSEFTWRSSQPPACVTSCRVLYDLSATLPFLRICRKGRNEVDFDPQKLLNAKRQKAEARRQEEEELQRQEIAEHEAIEKMREEVRLKRAKELELRDRHRQLESYAEGIYSEISKLSIKWPTQPVSKRTLDQANRAISESSQLLAAENDRFSDELTVFEPAGDVPEARDVTLVLRQVLDALNRMKARHVEDWR